MDDPAWTRDAAAALVEVWTLSLAETSVSDLSMLKSPELHGLDIAGTPVSELEFISRLPSLSGLNFKGTNVADFEPVLSHPTLLTDTSNMDHRDGSAYYLDFADTPVSRKDPALGTISQIENKDARQKALRDYLGLSRA